MRRLWHSVRPILPKAAISALASGHHGYLRYRSAIEDRRDRHRELPFEQIPPAWLRFRVGGSIDLDHFLAVGERTARDIREALNNAGIATTEFNDVLDFGCGCARALLWMALASEDVSSQRWHGTDIDAEAIAWCRQHLPTDRFTFAVNPELPPLDVADASYDFIYGISVFTHLDAARQDAWLAELRRVTRPGGVVLLTVHGESCAEGLSEDHRRTLRRKGFLFTRAGSTSGLFPDWYQSSYQTPEDVRTRFGRHFLVLNHIPRGINDHQDAVILRREG